MKLISLSILFMIFSVLPVRSSASDSQAEIEQQVEAVNPLELIEHHMGDSYSWPLFGLPIKQLTLSLPVIVYNKNTRQWSFFSSSHLEMNKEWKGYYISESKTYAGKVVYLNSQGDEVRPVDLSITRNVAALFVAGILLCSLLFSLTYYYKRNPLRMPRRLFGALEMLIDMLDKEVIRPCLGRHAPRYTPYLLSLFFFILTLNLLGMIVVFPGGVNLSGNVSICLVLAVCTLILTIISGTRRYWREIFLPDVPLWLNTPIPLMTIVEIFGIFTKPMALLVRMFANLFGGHVIIIVLTSLIFIFAPMGLAVASGVSVFVVLFSVFMLLIEFLVCFIQAYVFFMLSSLFIGLVMVEK
ncbi:MAG: F0F1 ATP synthase subunit A [Bacteroidales bacterium]